MEKFWKTYLDFKIRSNDFELNALLHQYLKFGGNTVILW